MTPLEFIGAGALVVWAMKVIGGLRRPKVTQEFGKALEEQLAAALREAFNAGMLTAADMVMLSGQEEAAGRIRKVVEYANDNNN